MKFSVVDGVIIWGCFILSFALLMYAAPNRPGAGRKIPRTPLTRRIALAIAGLAGSTALAGTMTYGTFRGPWMWVIGASPVLLGLWWIFRAFQQKSWMQRWAGRTGMVLDKDRPGRPSFGLLSACGHAVRFDDPAGSFDLAVEADSAGHRVLGIQFRRGMDASTESAENLTKVEQTDSRQFMVQLACPVVPALVLDPVQMRELLPGESRWATVTDDTRIAMETFNAPVPPLPLKTVERQDWAQEFRVRFEVRTENEEFAMAVLTPQVQHLVANDGWLRLRRFGCHFGTLWVTGKGRLTEANMRAGVQSLARLAAAIPPEVWRAFAPAPDAERFLTRIRQQAQGFPPPTASQPTPPTTQQPTPPTTQPGPPPAWGPPPHGTWGPPPQGAWGAQAPSAGQYPHGWRPMPPGTHQQPPNGPHQPPPRHG